MNEFKLNTIEEAIADLKAGKAILSLQQEMQRQKSLILWLHMGED